MISRYWIASPHPRGRRISGRGRPVNSDTTFVNGPVLVKPHEPRPVVFNGLHGPKFPSVVQYMWESSELVVDPENISGSRQPVTPCTFSAAAHAFALTHVIRPSVGFNPLSKVDPAPALALASHVIFTAVS